MLAGVWETEDSRPFLTITRLTLYALFVFTPLAVASVQDWAITVIHLLTLIALTSFLFEKSFTWDWRWIKTPLGKPIICLLILSLLASLFSLNRSMSFRSMVLLMDYVVIFYLVIHTVRTRSDFRRLLWLIIFIGAFLSLFGLFKKYIGNPFPWWNYGNIPENAGHLISTYGNRNHLTGYLEMALPLAFALLITGYTGIKRFALVLLSILLAGVLLFAMSRGGWISGFCGLLFMAIVLLTSRHFDNKKAILVVMVSSFVLIIIGLSSTALVERILSFEHAGETGSFVGRAKVWGGVMEMIRDHPVFGVGPGNFANAVAQYLPPAENRHYYAHNDYLQFVSVVGLPLVLCVLWMVICTYKRGFKKLKNESRLVRGATVGALSGITALLVHSMVDFNLNIPANAILFTVLVALAVSPLPSDNKQN